MYKKRNNRVLLTLVLLIAGLIAGLIVLKAATRPKKLPSGDGTFQTPGPDLQKLRRRSRVRAEVAEEGNGHGAEALDHGRDDGHAADPSEVRQGPEGRHDQ